MFPKLLFSITLEKMRVRSSWSPEKKEAKALQDTLQDKSHKRFEGESAKKHYSRDLKAGMGAVKELQQLYAHVQNPETTLSYLLCRRAASLTTLHPAGRFFSRCH